MIPRAFITEWKQFAPWKTNEQVEQYLVITRALMEIFSDKSLSEEEWNPYQAYDMIKSKILEKL